MKKITCQICFDLENTYDCFGGRRSWLCLVAWICGRALLLPFMMVIYFFYCIFGLNVKALVSHSYSSLNESITCFTEDKGIFLCTIDFGPIRWAMHINMTGWSSLWVGVSNVPSTQKRGAPLILWRDLADFIK